MIIEMTIAGPDFVAAAWPVNTKMPVPIIAPMPRVTRLTGPNARFKVCSPVAAASALILSIDLVANNDIMASYQILKDLVETGVGFDAFVKVANSKLKNLFGQSPRASAGAIPRLR